MDLRQYDPAIGRWVVQDPIVHHDFSPYSAFDNNPVYWSDPSGADATAYTLNGNLVGATFTGKDAIDAFFHLTDDSPEKTFEVAVTKFYEFSDFDENNGNGGGGGGDPFVGKKVLNAKTSTLGRLWATLEPRTWTSPYNLVYNVDADGIVTGIRPLGGLGVLGFVNGGGAFKVATVNGFYVRSSTTLSNGVYTRTVQSLASMEEGTSITKLIRTFEAEARASGAKTIIIKGVDIVEKRLIKDINFVTRFGYNVERIGENTIKIIKNL